jgi:hypothetical protein
MYKKDIEINLWISTDLELPPKDDYYYVTNHPSDTYDLGVCFYDGFGFIIERIYRNVKFWTYVIKSEKKYGKLKDKDD